MIALDGEKLLRSDEVERIAQRSYGDGWEPFGSHNFYHDCVVRHLDKGLIALKTYEQDGWREWSYDYIHRLVNYQVNRWQSQQEGQSGNIAIVMPFGIHFLVALLTAVRLGLTFTALPTDSPILPQKRIRKFLDQLKVDQIFTTPSTSAEIQGEEPHWLIEYLEEREKYNSVDDHLYQAEDCFQIAYGSLLQQDHFLVPVSAEEVYFNALRDGTYPFELKPGVTFAYSPDCSLREQPYLIMTTMLAGATTQILPFDKLLQNPEMVSSHPIHLLRVTPLLRELWAQQKGLPKSKLRLWFYNLFDDDEKLWSFFVEYNRLEKISSRRLLLDNASSAVVLSSIEVTDEPRDHLWPSFRRKWELLQYGQQEVSSVHPYGVFKQHSIANLPTNIFLTRSRVGWEVAGTMASHKRGYTIPLQDLEQAVIDLEFVDLAFFLTVPLPYCPLTTKGILLVFIDPMLKEKISSEQTGWKNKVNDAIANTIGTFFIPEQIEFYPLFPKIEEGTLDRNWCYHQYAGGFLNRKKEIKAYQWLSLLKKAALDQ